MREPVFHSGITDDLPEGHPLYWTTIYCVRCQQMVHGTPNENMQPWAETGRGAYCLLCFAAAWDEVEPEDWALHSDGSGVGESAVNPAANAENVLPIDAAHIDGQDA